MVFILKNLPNIQNSTRYLTQGRVTRPRSINFTIRIGLDLGHRLLESASTTNLESGPRFADIWLSPKNMISELQLYTKNTVIVRYEPVRISSRFRFDVIASFLVTGLTWDDDTGLDRF